MIRKGNYESTNKKWVDDTFDENLHLFNNILLFKKKLLDVFLYSFPVKWIG